MSWEFLMTFYCSVERKTKTLAINFIDFDAVLATLLNDIWTLFRFLLHTPVFSVRVYTQTPNIHVYMHFKIRFAFDFVSQTLKHMISHLLPIFFLHTVHTFSSVIMHFTCWCKIRSSWTYGTVNKLLKKQYHTTVPF